ncbi:MAG: hypothetical protein ACRD5F_12770 [Candidatus Acidiferrales bacterium]
MKGRRMDMPFGAWGRFQSMALLAVCGVAPTSAQPRDDARVLWKPVPMALLRVDDRAPKNWHIYGAEERKHSLLVQLGGRFLLLDVQAKRVYEIAPRTLARKGDTLEWNDTGTADSSGATRPSASAGSGAPSRQASATSSTAGTERARSSAARDVPDKALLPSSGWSMRDVGPMLRIRIRLTDEGRNFDIQIPIQPDLRQFY